ncbi:MAG: acetate--CoA ligase family protein, partial [Gammaproteobacteria bacterium]|nr:acetate--CoA ligase family protein [Gammaproteobacteria bacterium]
IYPVNPRYDQVAGERCYPSLQELPETVDHVVIAVANAHLEAALSNCVEHGARAATIFASCILEIDTEPPLTARLAAIAADAGLALCGGNGMGFINPIVGLNIGVFPAPMNLEPGRVTWIAQSGSVFGVLPFNEPQLRFNLCVSTGAELVTTASDYFDWALHQDETAVVGLFLEALRDPVLFQDCLRRAADRQIPVVILKTGRTAQSAAMAQTHTGAMAGSDAAYSALFRKYGVLRVRSIDEMAATLMLFSAGRTAAPGGLVSIHDSGGECEVLIDLAADIGVPIAPLSEHTKSILSRWLDPGLAAVNPLDAWGTGHNAQEIFERCLAALLDDDHSGAGILVTNPRDHHYHHKRIVEVLKTVAMATDKPVALVSNYAGIKDSMPIRALYTAGIPVLRGTEPGLCAIKHLFAFRDFQNEWGVRAWTKSRVSEQTAQWQRRLADGEVLGEYDAMAMLADFDIEIVSCRLVSNRGAALEAATEFGCPLVAKTAVRGIVHKSDVAGVALDLRCEKELLEAYDDLNARLGAEVLIAPMLSGGAEIALGVVNDPQFGPYIMLAAGGRLIEVLDERAYALAPVGLDEALRLIGTLRIKSLLDGIRGGAALDTVGLARAIVNLSQLAIALRDVLGEIDVNPLLVFPDRVIAVDAVVVPRAEANA